jgi:protease-4
MLQAGVDSIYRHFLGIVAQSRHKQPADVDKIAQGRVWDGGTARQLGLIDGFGGLKEAIDKAGALAKISNPQDEVRYLERPQSFEEKLVALLANDSASSQPEQDAFAAIAPETSLTAALVELRSVLSGPRIQARCLDCGPQEPARVTKNDLGFFAAVKALLFG